MPFITEVNKLNHDLENIIEKEQQGKIALFCKFDVESLLKLAQAKYATWSTIKDMDEEVLTQLYAVIQQAKDFLEYLCETYNLTKDEDILKV